MDSLPTPAPFLDEDWVAHIRTIGEIRVLPGGNHKHMPFSQGR